MDQARRRFLRRRRFCGGRRFGGCGGRGGGSGIGRCSLVCIINTTRGIVPAFPCHCSSVIGFRYNPTNELRIRLPNPDYPSRYMAADHPSVLPMAPTTWRSIRRSLSVSRLAMPRRHCASTHGTLPVCRSVRGNPIRRPRHGRDVKGTRDWDVVRRLTGGRAILHADELTYSICAPLRRSAC